MSFTEDMKKICGDVINIDEEIEKKYEAAYSRIDDNFKVINSLENFSENAANFIGKSELIKKIKYKNITENNTYLSFDCDITTDKGTKKCNFVFSKNATLPIDLNFSQSKKNKKTQLKKVSYFTLKA